MTSLTALIASEASLVHEAALAVPHSFDKCTHSRGPIRQAVHLCLTCADPRGLCSACSVACHGDHEQIELFPKRAFACDCPTRVGDTDCKLHKGVVEGNEKNMYGQNFHGKFCRCRRPYDAKRERETMVQCVVCEDWYHESCLNLRTRPNERPSTVDPPAGGSDEKDDMNSDASNDLPPPLLSSSTYDSLICGPCVLGNETLRRWAGTESIMMVVTEGGDKPSVWVEEGGVDPRWKVLNGENNWTTVVAVEEPDRKRERDNEEIDVFGTEGRTQKKPRTENHSATIESSKESLSSQAEYCIPCLAPPVNSTAQQVLSRLLNQASQSSVTGENTVRPTGEGDIFLTEGWRERWCRCPKCFPSLQKHLCLLQEEETYEPPEDPDSGVSLEELGMRALLNLPRDRAIDGIRAYNDMRDELMNYLRPFAQEGRVVREEDVRDFFAAKTQTAKG